MHRVSRLFLCYATSRDAMHRVSTINLICYASRLYNEPDLLRIASLQAASIKIPENLWFSTYE